MAFLLLMRFFQKKLNYQSKTHNIWYLLSCQVLYFENGYSFINGNASVLKYLYMLKRQSFF